MNLITEYSQPRDLLQAINARLAAQAEATGLPADRLRRRMAFERLLVRLDAGDPGRWVLKGGMAFEIRWRERARATRDLDLAVRRAGVDAGSLRATLIEAVAVDVDGDGFRFEIAEPQEISADQAGRPGWRVPVTVLLAGKPFAHVRLDIVARAEELEGTERVPLPGSLSFAGIAPRDVEAIDLAQHFAEKVHAMTRTYGSGGEPSSRVRDLVDLVLMIETSPPEPSRVHEAAVRVFQERATHPLPGTIPDPPAGWRDRYAEFASQLDLGAADIDEAMKLVRELWHTTTEDEGRSDGD